jgi:hypothetical protein
VFKGKRRVVFRRRFAGALLLVALIVVAAAASSAGGASSAEPEVTIDAGESSILAGDGVVVYGRVTGIPVLYQPGTVLLYEHLAGSSAGFTQVGETTADARGLYEFSKTEGEVLTNRSWFVRVAGAGAESRTVHAQVAALVTLKASRQSVETDDAVVFTGHVSPERSGARVLLQEQIGASDDWRTLDSDVLDPKSDYSMSHRWSEAGAEDVRVLFEGDVRNVDSPSNPVTVIVQQHQQGGLTISSSSQPVAYGEHATISGVLDREGTTTPEPGTALTLWAKNTAHFSMPVANTTTDANGRYDFAQVPTYSTEYQVRTSFPPYRFSAVMLQAVADTLSLTASATEAAVGASVRFSGMVQPLSQSRAIYPGHAIYLQRLGDDGHWHTVAVRYVNGNSTYRFDVRLGQAGSFKFRARITGDEANVGAASTPVTVAGTLPPASP